MIRYHDVIRSVEKLVWLLRVRLGIVVLCLSHDCHVIQVEELVRLSLNRPVRLFVDGNTDMAHNLRQEFVRVKAKKEGDREAIVTGIGQRG